MGKYILLIIGIFATVLFLNLPKTHAVEPADIIVNEILPRPSAGADSEFIELYNKDAEEVDLSGWFLDDIASGGSNPYKIPDGTLIGSDDYLVFYKITTKIALNDTGGDSARLLLPDGTVVSNCTYTTTVPIDSSWARNSAGEWGWSDKITPGEKNFEPPPPPPAPLASTNLNTEIVGNKVKFSWENLDTQPLTFELVVYQNNQMVISEPPPDPAKLEYLADFDWGAYTWEVIASNGVDETSATGPPFELVMPVYSHAIIVNEVLPHPSNSTDDEFIELYNTGLVPVDLGGWFLDDIADAGSVMYEIPAGKIIGPNEYLIFKKLETKISLNDTGGDYARLLSPDKILKSSCFYSETASLDLSWARDVDTDWEWTEELTPGAKNIIYLTPEDDDESGKGGDDEEITINTKPIEIKTGEFRDFNQKLVAVTGTIISTSGNTFYLDDGSGQAKIYLQDARGIDKPPMHRGDIFAIIGIVNLYRNTWRILPQKQSDVKLIKCIKEEDADIEAVSNTTTKTTTKSSTAGKSTAQARAPTLEPIVKQVKAAETSSVVPQSEPANTKNSWWLQMIEALTGLAIIFLILLIIKIRRFPKVKVIGGHFGEDET